MNLLRLRELFANKTPMQRIINGLLLAFAAALAIIIGAVAAKPSIAGFGPPGSGLPQPHGFYIALGMVLFLTFCMLCLYRGKNSGYGDLGARFSEGQRLREGQYRPGDWELNPPARKGRIPEVPEGFTVR